MSDTPFERAWQSIRDEGHYMVPTEGRELDWLVEQLARWPSRVDQDKTTNIRFLMQSAAATIMNMREKSA